MEGTVFMTVTFYNTNDTYNTVNKALTQIKGFDSLPNKQDIDILNPSIIMTYDASYLTQVNYMYIDDFKRYYFVKITGLTGGRVQIDGIVDALMSWKSDILKLTGIVETSQSFFKKYEKNNFPELVYKRRLFRKSQTRLNGESYILIACGGKKE